MKPAIYLDYAATTPMHPAVLERFTTALHEYNMVILQVAHQFGRHAKKVLEDARKTLASSINAVTSMKSLLLLEEQKQIT